MTDQKDWQMNKRQPGMNDDTGDDGSTTTGSQRGQGGMTTNDAAVGSQGANLGSQTSGQVSGGGERSGAETRSGITGGTSGMTGATGMTGGQGTGMGGGTSGSGDWGNKSGSGSGGQGESDMDETSTRGTNG